MSCGRYLLLVVAGVAMTSSARGESDFWEEMANPGIREYRAFVTVGRERIDSGDYTRALESLEQARSRLPNDAEAHGLIGYALSRNGEHELAVTSWDRARELDFPLTEEEPLAFECAQSYARVGRYRDAAEIHGQLLARGVSAQYRVRVLLMMGDMLVASSCDDLDDSIDLFQEAVRDYPHNAGAHWRLATALHRADRADEAEVELAAALRLDPQWQTFAQSDQVIFPSRDAHFFRALGWEQLGHREQAEREWQTYLDNGGADGCWAELAREHHQAVSRRTPTGRRR